MHTTRQILVAWTALAVCFFPKAGIPEEVAFDVKYLSRADRAASYIQSVQLEDGFFRYEYDFLKGRWSNSDNLVRQAGAAYALAQYLSEFPERGNGRSSQLALNALTKSSIPFADGLVVSKDGALASAKTGTTALALATAVLLGADHPSTELWLNALLALQRSDGDFQKRPLSDEASPYFDGESWLALALARDAGLDGERLEKALRQTDDALIKKYTKAPSIGFFHWGQLASLVRYNTTKDPRLVDFAAHQVEYLLSKSPTVSTVENRCYAVEGLAASLQLLEMDRRHEANANHVAARIKAELSNSATFQIQPGQTVIDVREGVQLQVLQLDEFTGAFFNGRYRMQSRIDFTQHCLSAFLAASKLALN